MFEMKSKEEILDDYIEPGFNYNYITENNALKAMEEYAIELHYGYKQWVNDIVEQGGERKERLKKLSDKELFTLFLNEQKQS